MLITHPCLSVAEQCLPRVKASPVSCSAHLPVTRLGCSRGWERGQPGQLTLLMGGCTMLCSVTVSNEKGGEGVGEWVCGHCSRTGWAAVCLWEVMTECFASLSFVFFSFALPVLSPHPGELRGGGGGWGSGYVGFRCQPGSTHH